MKRSFFCTFLNRSPLVSADLGDLEMLDFCTFLNRSPLVSADLGGVCLHGKINSRNNFYVRVTILQSMVQKPVITWTYASESGRVYV